MYYFKLAALLCLALMPLFALSQFSFADCPRLPPRNISTSILNLHPSDIKIVMAMGDSITSSFGINGSWNESRGHSFSVGGDAGAVTLPNILKTFNPSLVGYSVGTEAAVVCTGDSCPGLFYYPAQDSNNAAKSGTMVSDMVSLQVNYLIRQINQNPTMDVARDWKVLTIMIGANDLCASCAFNLTYLSPDDYQTSLMGTLERIRTSLPRTFVNLVPGYNMSRAYDLSLRIPRCANVSRDLFIECDCLFKPDADDVRETVDSYMTQYNARAAQVAAYYQHKAYDNFAVVVQPFASDSDISELPSRFISHLDCFHPSSLGQAAMAIALWNNMVTPAAYKQTYLNMSDTPICPTASTLLYTF